MNELTLHPNVYSAGGHCKGLISILERAWVRDFTPGDGTIYVISGFANYNGGVRFFDIFKNHILKGGKVVAIFSGSANSRLTSKQIVKEMLECGAEVHIINRKRLLHAKCYGTRGSHGDILVVTSGNFTGPGMSQNVEMSVLLDSATTSQMGFSWNEMMGKILEQKWNFYNPTLDNLSAPAWKLLYDEQAADIVLDETEEVTMILVLGHADTVRINADPGSTEGKGTQYFWLSKDCYDFFPPLTIHNARGHKATYSCLLKMNYVDINQIDESCRVTFEAENNLDFRLGTGKLRYSKLAKAGDIAAITRVAETEYQLRLFQQGTDKYNLLSPYAITFIGHQGKKYGFISNSDFDRIIKVN